VHAERLRDTATLHALNHSGHGLMRALRESGWLHDFLLRFGPVAEAPERQSFRRRTYSLTENVVCDLSASTRTLLIAFSGLALRLPGPVFEFSNAMSQVAVQKVCIRDPEQAWYQHGVQGIGTDIDSVTRYLSDLTDGKRAILIGNSAGGYGALVFGLLLGVEVHAFSPQTFLTPELRER
jgi:hypothetical protein